MSDEDRSGDEQSSGQQSERGGSADGDRRPDVEAGSQTPPVEDGEPAVEDVDSAEGSSGGESSAECVPAAEPPVSAEPTAPGRRLSATRAVVVVLMVLLGFTFTVVVRSVADDPAAAALGQEDLVRILANLDAHEERLRHEIGELQETQRRLTSADESQQEALAEARRRADELGVLAGTLPVRGPGIVVELRGGADALTAARLLDAVQELRSAGAEAMELEGAEGTAVRVVASSFFVEHESGILVDGELMRGPFTLTVVGEPETLEPALRIPGGVAESVHRDGGTVIVHEEPGGVEVSAVRGLVGLEHARPGS